MWSEKSSVHFKTNFFELVSEIEDNNEIASHFGEALKELQDNVEAITEQSRKVKADKYPLKFSLNEIAKFDDTTEKILKDVELEILANVQKIKNNPEILNLDSNVHTLVSLMKDYWADFCDSKHINAINKFEEKLENLLKKYGKTFELNLLYLLDANRLPDENRENSLTFLLLEALFLITQTFIMQIYLTIKQYAFCADKYFQIGDVQNCNKYIEIISIYCAEKREIFDEIKQTGFIKRVKHYFKKALKMPIVQQEIFELLSNRLSTLDTYEEMLSLSCVKLCLDQPANIIQQLDFSKSKIKTPIGDWKQDSKVMYAVQYWKNKSFFSKISDWSKPHEITDKANPEICLPLSFHNGSRLIFRKIDNHKPELVGIVEDTKQTVFRDIDCDLYRTAETLEESFNFIKYKVLLRDNVSASTKLESGRSAIHAAAFVGNFDLMKQFLVENKKGDIDLRDSYGYTALHFAAKMGHVDIVRLLIKNYVDPNARTSKDHFTPMHLAALKGHGEVLEALLKFQITNATAQDTEGCNALHYALFGGPHAVDVLLESCLIDVNAKSNGCLTPLHLAVLNQNIAAIKALLRTEEIDVESATLGNLTAVHLAVLMENEEMINCLLTPRVNNLNAPRFQNFNALHFAVSTRNEILVLNLLNQCKINVNAASVNGLTPLHIAAKTGQKFIVECILKAGAAIDAQTKSDLTPLHIAAKFGCLDALKTLVEHGADMKLKTKDGLTPLLMAASSKKSSVNVLVYLLENGSSIQAASDAGLTFEWLAARQGGRDVVTFLIQNFDGPNFTDELGNKLQHHAAQGENLDILTMLIDDYNYDINAINNKNETPLHLATDLETVKFLLRRRANIDAEDCKHLTPLFTAVRKGKFQIFKLLLQSGAKVENSVWENILHYVAENGDLEFFKFLIEDQNFEPNARSYIRNTPLFIAARNGKLDIVKYLAKDKQINVHKTEYLGRTCVHEASINGHLDIVRYLVSERCVDIRVRDIFKATEILYAAESNSLETVKFLFEHGADINDTDDKGENLLHFAARGGSLSIINFLIVEKSLDPRSLNSLGSKPLLSAAASGKLAAVKYFMEVKKISIKHKNYEDQTALHFAALKGHFNVISYLVNKKGANVHDKCKDGMTPLLCAAQSGNFDAVQFLLINGANIDQKDNVGENLLSHAAKGGNLSIIKFLIEEKNFDPNIVGIYENPPLFLVTQSGNLDAVKYFVEKLNVNINAKYGSNRTLFFEAIEWAHLHIVKYLVEDRGVNLNITNSVGLSPYKAAVEGNCNAVANYLKSRI